MKKVSIILFALFLVFSTFAGCKKKEKVAPETPETHTHDWGEVTYTWSSDNLSCTATRVCKGDASHKEEETKTATYKVSVEAECEKEGKGESVSRKEVIYAQCQKGQSLLEKEISMHLRGH